jgi:hypothetical protein
MIGSRNLALRCLTLAVALFALALSARADHKDARLGFTMQTPRGWTPLPMKVDEKWLVADYQGDKPFFWTDKASGWTNEHRPDMQVVAFVSEDIKAKAKVTKGTDKKGNESIFIEFDSPYKDYKDYMQRRYSGGGWFIEKEEQTTVGDVKVTAYEIRVEKLSYSGPKRIITWIYHIQDVDVAVQYEMLTDAALKLSQEVARCLKSFKVIPRSGEALSNNVSTGKRLTLLDMDEVSPEERKNARISLEKEAHELATKKLTEGWNAKRMGRFYVLNHSDEKLAKAIVEQAGHDLPVRRREGVRALPDHSDLQGSERIQRIQPHRRVELERPRDRDVPGLRWIDVVDDRRRQVAHARHLVRRPRPRPVLGDAALAEGRSVRCHQEAQGQGRQGAVRYG